MDAGILKRRTVKRYLTYAGVTLIGVVMLSCTSCAKAPPTSPAPAGPAGDRVYDLAGFMTWPCDRERPKFFLGESAYQSQKVHDAAYDHEVAHKALAMTFGSCQEFKRWIGVRTNWLTFEAIGYCASVRARVRHGEEPSMALATEARNLASPYYNFGITAEEAARKIAAVCR